MNTKLILGTVLAIVTSASASVSYAGNGRANGPDIIPVLGEVVVRTPVIYVKVLVNPGSPAGCALAHVQISAPGAAIAPVATGEEARIDGLYLPIDYKIGFTGEVPNVDCMYTVVASDESHNSSVTLVDDIIGMQSPDGTISFNEGLWFRPMIAD